MDEPIIVVSNRDPVGRNAIFFLRSMRLNFKIVEEEPVDFKVNSENLIVLCRHSSLKGINSIAVHHPGNPTKEALLGGEPLKLPYANPGLAKEILKELYHASPKGYEVTYEATHHGPTPDGRILFVEIGSNEEKWNDLNAIELIVKSVNNSIKKTPYCKELAVGLGGGHYAPRFTELAIEEDICFGHIISKHYLSEIREEVILDAIYKSNAEAVYIYKNSYVDKLIKVLEKIGIKIKIV